MIGNGRSKRIIFFKLFFIFIILHFYPGEFIHAQLPDPNFFYYNSGTTIFNYSTLTNSTTTNTIVLPAGAQGLAVNNNFFSATPAVTFYTSVGASYKYYDGSAWVSTGHNTGNMNATNMGGAGSFIYNWDLVNSKLYKYNGTGAATLVMSLSSASGGIGDVVGDGSGNFYILKINPTSTLTQFNASGVVIATYSLSGFPAGFGGNGFAIVNNTLYTNVGVTNIFGTISGTTVTYGGPVTLSVSAPNDYASWPLGLIPLPVELVQFEGIYNKDTRKNDLIWRTSSEINNHYFTVEYSSDALDWKFLSNIDGAGNSNVLQTYLLSHSSPYQVTYYRLSQTDMNGSSTFFSPITVMRPSGGSVQVYPNPAFDVLHISSMEVIHSYAIYDATGRVVMQMENAVQLDPIDIGSLQPGLYYCSLEINGSISNIKFIKE
jgi:hypothetical protein